MRILSLNPNPNAFPQQTKYGGRRAALDAREECYAKIERVEKEKWGLRDCLVAEKRQVRYGVAMCWNVR